MKQKAEPCLFELCWERADRWQISLHSERVDKCPRTHGERWFWVTDWFWRAGEFTNTESVNNRIDCMYVRMYVAYLSKWDICAHKVGHLRMGIMFWPLFQFPRYLPTTTYTHKHNFFHQIKAIFSWKQTRVFFMCAYCIKYCSVRIKMKLKIIVPKPQFNILNFTMWNNFSLAAWKFVIHPYW